MNTFSVVPSLLNIFFKSTSFENTFGIFMGKFLKSKSINIKFEIAFNLVAFLIQISVFSIIFLPILPVNNTWDLCISIVFLSISYWENFIDKNFIGKTKNQIINNLKKSIECSRHRTLLLITIWKIGFIFIFAYLIYPKIFTNTGTLFTADSHFIVFFTNIISSFLCYYLSLLACKLCMQRSSFSLPITLSFPVFFSAVLLLCKYLPNDSILKQSLLIWTCNNNYTSGSFKWIILCGLLWWLAHVWVNRHIWINITQRLTSKRRLNLFLIFI
jgi:chitin synthase